MGMIQVMWVVGGAYRFWRQVQSECFPASVGALRQGGAQVERDP